MNFFNKLKRILTNPSRIILWLINTPLFSWISDKDYLCTKFRLNMKKKLDLNNPLTYNEKLQWLKLYDRNDKYTMMVDKYLVRDYIREQLGEEYLIPLIGVWDNPNDIDFDALPDKFVLKCNHNSGLGMCICTDKSKLDFEKVRRELTRGIKQDYYLTNREWPYKNVPRKIIAEAYMEDSETSELRDYKFFCFNGEVKAMFVATDRQKKGEEVKFDFFDENYNHLPIKQGHPNAPTPPEKPKCFEEMKDLASKLSQGIPHVRVDFYEVNGKIYFGELTFFHFAGMVPFVPEEWDRKFGDCIDLSLVEKK